MPIATWLRPIIPNRLMMLLSSTDTRRNIGNPDARYNTWLWAKLLQEEYPSEGYSMNTRSTPREVEALQARAREYTRQQVEQMDEWERAFYHEWTSLISRNAVAFPYPMERESEAQTLIATPIHGCVERESEAQTLMATPIRGYVERKALPGNAEHGLLPIMGSHDRPFRAWRHQSLVTDDGRNFGGWNDDIRIDPNYSSLPELEFREFKKIGDTTKLPRGTRYAGKGRWAFP